MSTCRNVKCHNGVVPSGNQQGSDGYEPCPDCTSWPCLGKCGRVVPDQFGLCRECLAETDAEVEDKDGEPGDFEKTWTASDRGYTSEEIDQLEADLLGDSEEEGN